MATKIRLRVGDARPAGDSALRFATKLPNASNESGLGLDTTDFFVTGLIGKTVQSVRIVGNIGLGDPVAIRPTGDRQNDVLTYGLSIARAVRAGLEIVGEINGRLQHHARRHAARNRQPVGHAAGGTIHARHGPRGRRHDPRHDVA